MRWTIPGFTVKAVGLGCIMGLVRWLHAFVQRLELGPVAVMVTRALTEHRRIALPAKNAMQQPHSRKTIGSKLVRSLGKISCAVACCGMLLPAHVGTYTWGRQNVSRANRAGADRQGRQADVVPNTFPIHQKSEDLCNNREQLTGKKLPFPGMEPRTLQTATYDIDH